MKFHAKAMIFTALILASCAPALAGHRVEKNLLIDTHGKVELRGDMYIPDSHGPFPAILFFHGGGFIRGDRNDPEVVRLVEIFAEHGYAVFNADYRFITNGGLFPNNTKDANCALAWLKKNGEKYGVDLKRIAVMGESAGAYLAAMVAFAQGVDYLAPDCGSANGVDMSVKAAALFYGPYDFSSIKGGFTNLLEIELKRSMKLKTPAQANEYKAKNSPITYAANAPPSLLINSARDNIVDPNQTPELAAALQKYGRTFEHLTVFSPDTDHGFILNPPDTKLTANSITLVIDFLDRFLKSSD